MKNSKSLISVAIASVFMSMTASAAVEPDFLGEEIGGKSDESKVSKKANTKVSVSDKLNATKQEKQSSTKKSGVAESYSSAEAFIDPKIAAERSAETSSKQHKLQMLQLDMSALELQDAIYKIEKSQKQFEVDSMIKAEKSKWEKEKAELIADYDQQISDLKKSIKKSNEKINEKEEVTDFLKEKLFVTKTYGIGSNKHAQFYFENNISTRSVGEEIIPGAIVTKVNRYGAEVSYKGEKAFLNITTREYANSKTISREELEFQKSLEEAKYGVVKVPSDIGSIPPMPR